MKRQEADSSQTRTGSILGSPSYMSPEQATGAENVGPEADQYALGATLYEMLTGRPPFRGSSILDTLDLVRTKEPVPPSQLLPRMPRDLETICLKCLQKDPARRYPDVAALAEDLRRFRQGEPILARPVSSAERIWRWCLRNRKMAALAATVALLLMIVTVGSAVAFAVVRSRNQALNLAYDNIKRVNEDLTVAKAREEEKRREAEAEHRRAVAAGQAAIKQNRDVVAAQRDMIQLLELKQFRFVPGVQVVRERSLDLAAKTLESAIGSMAALRGEIGWPAADEELNWRTVASAYQRLAELSLSRSKYPEAIERFRQVNQIVARLAEAASGDAGTQVRLAKSRRVLGYTTMHRVGDSEEAAPLFRELAEDDPRQPGEAARQRCLQVRAGQHPWPARPGRAQARASRPSTRALRRGIPGPTFLRNLVGQRSPGAPARALRTLRANGRAGHPQGKQGRGPAIIQAVRRDPRTDLRPASRLLASHARPGSVLQQLCLPPLPGRPGSGVRAGCIARPSS